MEDVLDVYERPYDPKRPVVKMDEQPVQLVKDTRLPLEAQPGRPRRYDHEYERAGTACVFLFTEALAGWRQVQRSVPAHRRGLGPGSGRVAGGPLCPSREGDPDL